MSDPISNLFERFDRGVITRRQLLQALGIAAVGVPLASRIVDAQGRCGGANAGTAACDTTPAKLPFDVTGWKTTSLDHFSLQVEDVQKEAAYYQALMNWKPRTVDKDMVVMDIGDWATVEIRGGYVAPPAPPPFVPANPPAGGDTTGGRGGGRGGGGGGGAQRNNACGVPNTNIPRRSSWDGITWGIDPWDTKKVEAELRRRGLNPVADHRGKDWQIFHLTSPDGFNVSVSNGGGARARKAAASKPAAKLSAPAPFEGTDFKTVWLDHISYESPNYKVSAAFYTALLGWTPGGDEGSQNTMKIGDLGGIIVRGGGPQRGGAPARTTTSLGHISFGLEGFDYQHVLAELCKRGLNAREDTGARGPIAEARYKSYHTTTPNGFDLQISNTTKSNRDNG